MEMYCKSPYCNALARTELGYCATHYARHTRFGSSMSHVPTDGVSIKAALAARWSPPERPPCADDPELFFIPQSGNHTEQIEAARVICRTCPFMPDCLDAALRQTERWGIWAATTPMQRREIRMGRVPRG